MFKFEQATNVRTIFRNYAGIREKFHYYSGNIIIWNKKCSKHLLLIYKSKSDNYLTNLGRESFYAFNDKMDISFFSATCNIFVPDKNFQPAKRYIFYIDEIEFNC